MSNDNVQDTLTIPEPEQNTPSKAPKKKSLARRLFFILLKISGIALLAALCCAIAAVFYLKSEHGEQWLTQKVNESLASLESGLSVSAGRISGPIPSSFVLNDIAVKDTEGLCFKAREARLEIDWSSLFSTFSITKIILSDPELYRLPHLDTSADAADKTEKTESSLQEQINGFKNIFKNWPSALPALECKKIAIGNLILQKPVLGFFFKASCTADIHISRAGLKSHVLAQRLDADCPAATMNLSLNENCDLDASINATDFKILASLDALKDFPLAVAFQLRGQGPLDNINLASSIHVMAPSNSDKGRIAPAEQQGILATLGLDSNIRIDDKSLSLDTMLSIKNTQESYPLLQAAGLKKGLSDIRLKILSRLSDDISVDYSGSCRLTGLDWMDKDIASLAGDSPSVHFRGSLAKRQDNSIALGIEEISAALKAVAATAKGHVDLALHEDRIAASSINLSSHASCQIPDGLKALPFYGEGNVSADLSGDLNKLSASLGLKSSTFAVEKTTLQNSALNLLLHDIDVMNLLKKMPEIMLRMQETPAQNHVANESPASSETLLAGEYRCSTTVNGQDFSGGANLAVEDSQNGIALSLSAIDFRAGNATAAGDINVSYPYAQAEAAPGSIGELLQIPLPGINAKLHVNVNDWKAISSILGINIAGQPIDAQMQMNSGQEQALQVKARVPQVSCPELSNLHINNFEADVVAHDLWGYPELFVNSAFDNVKITGMDIGGTSVRAAIKNGHAAADSKNNALSSLSMTIDAGNNYATLDSARLQNTSLLFTLRDANIFRLIKALPQTLRQVSTALSATSDASLASNERKEQAETLLDGSCAVSSKANGLPLSLDTSWSIADSGKGLEMLLKKLELTFDKSRIKGDLTAEFPYAPAAILPGSLYELTGTTLPNLTGVLDIHIPEWKNIASLIGKPIAGSAFNSHVAFNAESGQSLTFKASLPQFSYDKRIALKDLSIDLSGKDLWASPSVNMLAGLSKLQTDAFALDASSLKASGNLNHADFSVSAKGDAKVDIAGKWQPGQLSIPQCALLVKPGILGLGGKDPVGLRLDKALTVSYGDKSLAMQDVHASIMPAGNVVMSCSVDSTALKIDADATHFDLSKFKPLLPQIPDGMIALNIHARGTPENPEGNVALKLKEIVPSKGIPPISTDILARLLQKNGQKTLNVVAAMAKSTKDAYGLSKADIQADIPFTTPAAGNTAMPDMEGPVSAHVLLNGNLEKLWKLLPVSDQRLTGAVALESSVTGKLSAPVIDAQLTLKNGRFVDILQGLQLTDIDLGVNAAHVRPMDNAGKVNIALAAGDGRKGSVSVKGNADLATMQFDMDGKINALAPLRRQDINIVLSGDVGLKGSVTDPSVKANIVIDKGRIQLANLPGGSITELEIYQPEQKQKKAEDKMFGTIDAHVSIPNQFFIQGYGLDCEWKGDVYAKGALTRPSVTGSLEAVRGTLDILSKNFKLAEGKISFDGGWPVSPMLNIDMEYQAANILADIIVGGTANNPKLSLTSKPALPRDEILAQVLFGQSSGSLSHVQALQLASAAATLAGFGGADMLGKTRKALGVDVLKLNSDNDGKDSDVSRTSLEMGTYIHDNIYVGMEQGIGKSNDTGAIVEVELLPGINAQAKTFSTKSEFGLKWKKNY